MLLRAFNVMHLINADLCAFISVASFSREGWVYVTTWGQWALELLQCTATLRGG